MLHKPSEIHRTWAARRMFTETPEKAWCSLRAADAELSAARQLLKHRHSVGPQSLLSVRLPDSVAIPLPEKRWNAILDGCSFGAERPPCSRCRQRAFYRGSGSEEHLASFTRVGKTYPFAIPEHVVIIEGWKPGTLNVSLTKTDVEQERQRSPGIGGVFGLFGPLCRSSWP